MNLDELLALEAPPLDVSSEAAYQTVWRTFVAAADEPFALAVRGGMAADRFAWVFIAGYQAAIRATFPNAAIDGWAAFAVSEDRSPDNPLPGVTWSPEGDGYCLQGHKTWVAASEHVARIIVRARGPAAGQSAFFLVDADDESLTLTHNPAPSMLPDLSQGRAHLQNVLLDASRNLDASRVADFSAAEVRHIYIAFLSMLHHRAQPEWGQTPFRNDAEPERGLTPFRLACRELLEVARDGELAVLDDGVQALRETLSAGAFADDADWQRDQRLIAMYSQGVQSRRG